MSRKKNTDIKSSIKEKISSTWGIIIAAFTIFGMGFGAGRYVANTYAKIQHNDDVMKLQKEILDTKEQNEVTVHDLRNQIYNLQEELIEERRNDYAEK